MSVEHLCDICAAQRAPPGVESTCAFQAHCYMAARRQPSGDLTVKADHTLAALGYLKDALLGLLGRLQPGGVCITPTLHVRWTVAQIHILNMSTRRG